MIRRMHTAVMAVMLAVGVVAVGAAQDAYPPTPPLPPQPKVQGSKPAHHGSHLGEAIKHTQAAIDAANSGQASLIAQEAEKALTHAEAAEKDSPNPNLKVAIKSLQEAVELGKAGKTDDAVKAAQEALAMLRANA